MAYFNKELYLTSTIKNGRIWNSYKVVISLMEVENMTQVVKRNNKISGLDIKEIRKALVWAVRGLEDKINYLEIETQIESIYRDKISTEEIQKSLIDIALRLTSVDQPEWRILAGRLLVMEVYKEAAINRNYQTFGYGDYLAFVKSAVEKGLYDKKLIDIYSDEELQEASKFINPDYDIAFDYAGMNMIVNRYLIQDRKKVFELPQEMFLTIALLIASTEKRDGRLESAKNIYNSIASREISLATPILINLRRSNGNLSSCFITAVDDSLDSIFYNINTIAQISKNGGGVGVNLSRIRAKGGEINKTPNASGGVLPWIKIINDTAVAVNQLGKRAGAVTAALDIWHLDIEDFMELQTENGDQRKKAYDIFPQIVIPDLFMKRVQENGSWTLLDPNEVRIAYGVDIAELWGDEFEKFYIEAEKSDKLKLKKSVSAKEIIKKIMKTQIETGMPYIFFKDTANRLNPNQHDGMVGNGNLCQESFSNFRPSKIGRGSLAENGKNEINYKSEDGLIHTCNLVSLNLAILLDETTLERAARMAVKILDNTIDLTESPVLESNVHNSTYRTIGIGAMGFADYLAVKGVAYSSEKALKATDELFEKIAYYVLDESADLAIERGAYPKFKGSMWDKGVFFGRDTATLAKEGVLGNDWEILAEKIKKNGIRNGQLLAIAPNTSSALVQGCTPSVLPVYSKFYIDKNSRGAVPICPPYIKEGFWYYQENKNIDQRKVATLVSRIQRWIDQGISFELLFNLNMDIKAKDIYETIFTAWEKGCKTLYYTRTIQKSSDIMSSKEECISCAN